MCKVMKTTREDIASLKAQQGGYKCVLCGERVWVKILPNHVQQGHIYTRKLSSIIRQLMCIWDSIKKKSSAAFYTFGGNRQKFHTTVWVQERKQQSTSSPIVEGEKCSHPSFIILLERWGRRQLWGTNEYCTCWEDQSISNLGSCTQPCSCSFTWTEVAQGGEQAFDHDCLFVRKGVQGHDYIHFRFRNLIQITKPKIDFIFDCA